MAAKTNAELAAFFNTGDQPSETEFGHLIDTIQPVPVLIPGDGSVTAFTVADHAFRTIIIDGSTTTDRSYALPVPALGTWYHFIYHGDLDDDGDNKDVAITQLAGDFLKGNIVHLNASDATGLADPVVFNGTNAIGVSLDVGNFADIWIMGYTSSLSYIWGMTVGDTVADVLT